MPSMSTRGGEPARSSCGFLVLVLALCSGGLHAGPLEMGKGDSIVIIGNTFAERMHLFGYFETFLHCRFSDHDLKVRNLGWSADELTLMPRPRGFGSLHENLAARRADLIFACFGMNESFRGAEHVTDFGVDLDRFVAGLLESRFNGESAPRVVLVSPIAHEDLGGDLPDGRDRRLVLEVYTREMERVALARKVGFVDLFTPTLRWMAAGQGRKLTFNGIHLTEYGYWVVSRMLVRALGLVDEIDAPTEAGNAAAEALRRAVYEKSYQFFYWWRAPNMSYIRGGRRDNRGGLRLPQERRLQVRLIESLDRRIHAMQKPAPGSIWRTTPRDGRPVWHPTPASRPIPRAPANAKDRRRIDTQSGRERAPARTLAQTLESFRVPEGYRVNLFASEVDFPIANPVALRFDDRGRLWVANSPTWPHPLPGEQPSDSIVVLEDSDRDGVADRHSVFLDRLNMVHGFAFGDGGAYVSQAPNMIFARDIDDDGRADRVQAVLHGFGTEDVEHAMNNFRWSPGGSLFLTQGIFYHTQVETPYGPERVRDGAVFRYRPGEHRVDVHVSHHFWNPYGNLFDHWGRGIVLDASAGQYYPMDVLSANFVYPKKKKRADHLVFSHESRIAAGCEFIRNRHFPPEVQGRFLVNDCVGALGTHWFDVEPRGSIFASKPHEPPLLRSRDPLFRPIAMAFGPDGALYILDFHSYIFENVQFSKRHPGRDHTHGRVWRISCKGRPLLKAPLIRGRPVAELLDLLKSYENTTRRLVRRELAERGRDAVLGSLDAWVADLDASDVEHEHHLLEALWMRQALNAVDRGLLVRVLGATDARARAGATRVLRYWQSGIEGAIGLLRGLVADLDPRVRLEAVLACGFSSSAQAEEVALEVAGHPLDPGLKHALDQTLRFFEESRRRQR